MIELTATAADVVRRSYVLHTRLESSLDGVVLAQDVPVAAGSLEVDRTIRVPERLTLDVPRIERGFSWDPAGTADHPLAPYGQILRLSLGIELKAGDGTEENPGDIEWIDRGRYLITEAAVTGDEVRVTAVGLLGFIEEARFTTPFQPSGTFSTTLRQLVEPALTVSFDAGLPTDRAVPASMSWDEDRLEALFELLDAWPADAYVDPTGTLQVVPAGDPVTPSLTLSDGVGGTVVKWAGVANRDSAYNMVVARGQAADGTTVQGVAYDLDPNSRLRYGGPFSPLPVPFFFPSPLLTTVAQCNAAAVTVLARLRRTAERSLVADLVPHVALEAGDLVTVEGDVEGTAVVERLVLPVTPGQQQPMTVILRVVSGG